MKIPGDIITSRGRARQLGFTHHSVILSGGGRSAFEVERAARRIVGKGGRVENLLAPPPGPPGVLGSPSSVAPRAFLSGSSAAAAFGSFSYRYFADGTIAPDPAWVAANIRTETMPIVGSVTGHRLMLPQLRGALTEIEAAGLGGFFMTYDGCYVPRFIARDPSRGISLHTWGIAIDLNASTNYRGIKGDMDPRVVTIFKRWGFRWGGDWRYTDPMHFELGSVQR